MPIETIIYQRDVLYAEVWAEPATTVAKRYSISSNALAKFCRRLHVPVPGRGYWARQAVGKQEPVPALPPIPSGVADKIVIKRRRRTLDSDRKKASLEKGRASVGSPIVVPSVLEQPHPLIERTRPLLENVEPQHGLLRPSGVGGVDVAASPPLLDRALRIMNTLLFALETRGFVVEVDGAGATRVLVGDEWIRFGIVERLKQRWPKAKKPPRNLHGTEREWWLYWNRPRMQLVPSGRLILEMKEGDVGVQVQWRDRGSRVEAKLGDFVKSLFVVAEAKKSARENDARWRSSFERDAEGAQRARVRAERRARRDSKVLQMLDRWKQARELRQLVEEMRVASNRGGQDVPRWVRWAERLAERIDPVGGGPAAADPLPPTCAAIVVPQQRFVRQHGSAS